MMALAMRPDVIFFLTDAEDPRLTADELDRIRRANKTTQIHAIEFGFGPSTGDDNFLKRLGLRRDAGFSTRERLRLVDLRCNLVHLIACKTRGACQSVRRVLLFQLRIKGDAHVRVFTRV